MIQARQAACNREKVQTALNPLSLQRALHRYLQQALTIADTQPHKDYRDLVVV